MSRRAGLQLGFAALFLLCSVASAHALPERNGPTRLLRNPSISANHIAFEYGGDIWIVARVGGDAKRITSFPGQETSPALSPDGRWIAFSAQYGGNRDVYIVEITGGEPRRLTWHPGAG